MSLDDTLELDLQFAKRGGLLPAAIQLNDGALMDFGYVSPMDFDASLKTGKLRLVEKEGNCLGNYSGIQRIFVDCDQDALVYRIDNNKAYNLGSPFPRLELGEIIPAIVTDGSRGNRYETPLMIGYANNDAFLQCFKGYATFWKTSENRLWTKGETSGDKLKMIYVGGFDNAIVYGVELEGNGVCHTGRPTCFYREIKNGRLEFT